MQSIQNTQRANQQILQNGANQILNVLTSGRDDADGDSTTDAPVGGNTDTVDDSNVNTPPPTVYTWQPAPSPSASAAVSALLDSDQPAPSAAAAVSALLDDGSQQNTPQPASGGTTTANAVANLLDSSKVSDSASAFAAYTSLPAPPDPQFAAAMQDSTDQPVPSLAATLPQMLQSTESTAGQVKDALTALVASTNSLISSYADSPEVYWLVNQGWKGTTVRLPPAGSTQEVATDLTFGQATVGLGDILEGMATNEYSKMAQLTGVSAALEGAGIGPTSAGVAQGIYNYGSKMVNQMGAFLGLANNTIFETGTDQQQ